MSKLLQQQVQNQVIQTALPGAVRQAINTANGYVFPKGQKT